MRFGLVEIADDSARDRERMMIVLRQMIATPDTRVVHIAPPSSSRRHDLPGGGFHERRATRKIVP